MKTVRRDGDIAGIEAVTEPIDTVAIAVEGTRTPPLMFFTEITCARRHCRPGRITVIGSSVSRVGMRLSSADYGRDGKA